MIVCSSIIKCRGVNLCRCVPGYTGDHCQLATGPANPPAAPRPACTRDMCRSIKRCRKQNCGYVARDNRWGSYILTSDNSNKLSPQ